MNVSTGKKKTIVREELPKQEEIIIEDGTELTYAFLLPHKTARSHHLTFHLAGQGARLILLGFDMGKQYESIVRSQVIHEAPATFSRTYIKSLLGGSAKSVFHGLIRLEKTADQADAGFIHNTLLVGDEASGQAEPTLEILANEVKAKHAATVSTFREDLLFYLASRGLSRSASYRLIAEGFLQEYLSLISHAQSREKLRQHLLRSLFLL